METDKLESYIRQQRDAFDVATPGPPAWEGRNASQAAPIRRFRIPAPLWQAAAAVLIFAMAWVGNDLYRGRQQREAFRVALEQSNTDAMPKELQKAAEYYDKQIETKKEELFHLASNAPDVRNDVNLELEELDKAFGELKSDLKDNADNQEVIEAMISNYRLKLQILEDMLRMLNDRNTDTKKQAHESDQIQL
jgi:hypothetical protein